LTFDKALWGALDVQKGSSNSAISTIPPFLLPEQGFFSRQWVVSYVNPKEISEAGKSMSGFNCIQLNWDFLH
jgi:hypothetical protein